METYASHSEKTLSWKDNLARRLLFQALTGLKKGFLVIYEQDQEYEFGDPSSKLVGRIIVKNKAFYRKVLLGGSIGAAESYVDEQWDSENLTDVVRLFALNMALLDKIEQRLSWLMSPINRISHWLNRNSHSGSKRNILAHYDLGNQMYQQFLDKEMLYSSGIYPDETANLAQAQQHKMAVICERLDLKPGHHLLEIGTGWGALAIYAAKHYGVKVTSTTISDAQYDYAKARIEREGLTQQIKLIKKDYRLLEGKFDRLVSVEMIEAVGHNYLPHFFKKLNSLLKDDGRLLLQAITIADQRYHTYRKNVDFIQKYIFPGGCLPSIFEIAKQFTKQTNMVICSLDDIGQDYARTLKHWQENFVQSLIQIRHLGYGDDFIRLWRFYLSYCEAGFKERSISDIHLCAAKPDYRES